MRHFRCPAGARAGRSLAAVALLLATAGFAEPAPSGPWRATPLVLAASPIPDLPGDRFVDFGTVFVRPGGELVFWAKLAGREDERSWALFSLRDGALKTILEEGEAVTSRYSAEPERKFHVHSQGRLHTPLFLHEGGMLWFTSHPGALMKDAGVFAWDGERIQPLLVPGQTVAVGGRPETIESAWVVAAQPSGGILVNVRTAKPSKRTIQAILRNGALQLADAEGHAPLPGPPASWGELLGAGKPYPFEAGRSVVSAAAISRQSDTRWVLQAITDDRRQRYVYADGSRLFDLNPPGLSQEKDWSFAVDQIEFLHPDRPLVVYRGQSSYRKDKPYAGTQIFLFDGESVRPLIEGPIYDVTGRTRIDRVSRGRFPGALIRALRGALPSGAIPDEWPLWFLDRDNAAAGLQPVPALELEDGKRIGLDAVRAWPSETVAIAVVPADGIYRLEESAVPAP